MIPQSICVILGIIAAIVCTILLYVLVLPKSKENQLTGFMKFLHDFFLFKKLYIEAVIRFFYTFSTMISICVGFFLLFGKQTSLFGMSSHSTFGAGLAMIIGGPIILRITYEFMMLVIILVTNVIAINNKIGGSTGKNINFADDSNFTEKFSSVASDAAKNVMDEVQKMGTDNNN